MDNWNLNQSGQVKRTTISVLSANCFAAAILCLSGAVMAGTVYVPMPTGTPTTDWKNVQAAIDSADDGDTVQFGVGEYVFGVDSEFVVVGVPGLRLVGHPQGTTIVGGEVLPIPGEPGSPYLKGNNSIFKSPPRGLHLTADEQKISNIRFVGFRTAVLIGYGDFADTGGYVVENCEISETMYGINAHVESDEVTAIRGNAFINMNYPYDLSGGRYHVSHNYLALLDPDRVPVDFTMHHSGVLAAGGPFYEEGGAFVTEHNLFEFNIVVGGVADGFEVVGDPGGLLRHNIFRNNEFYDMQLFYGTIARVISYGGDTVDNVFANNTLDGSDGLGILMLNYGGTVDGNMIVGNKLKSVTGPFGEGVFALDATNTIFLDNVITGIEPGDLWYGTTFLGGHSNQFLLNQTDAETAASFIESPDGIFASDDPADVAVDEFGNQIYSLDPNSNYKKLRRCAKILTDKGKLKKVHNDDIARSIEKFRSCVDKALAKLQ